MNTTTAGHGTWRGRLDRLLFVPDAERNAGLSPLACYLLPIFVFGLTRLLNILSFWHRHINQEKTDAQGYIATAAYVAAHGHLPTLHDQLYRQFPGLSLLMIPFHALLHNYLFTGEMLAVVSALLCLVLVQYLFDDVRLTILSTVFLPWTITVSISVASEWPTCLCLLIALWTLRDARRWSAPFCLGVLIGGYALLLRPPAMFFAMPLLGLWVWREPGGGLLRAIAVLALASVPYAALLTWNGLTIHDLFPEKPLQQDLLEVYRGLSTHPQYYSWHLLNPPGRSVLGGLLDPGTKPVKKVLTVVCLVLYLLALIRLIRLSLAATPIDELTRRQALALAGALAASLLFYLCVGGDFGFRALGRYMIIANIAVVLGLFHHRPLRWPWLVLLALICLLYATLTGGDNAFSLH
jgi:hypothetical protein